MATLIPLVLGVCCLVPLFLIGLIAAIILIRLRSRRRGGKTPEKVGEMAEEEVIVEGEYRELREDIEGGP